MEVRYRYHGLPNCGETWKLCRVSKVLYLTVLIVLYSNLDHTYGRTGKRANPGGFVPRSTHTLLLEMILLTQAGESQNEIQLPSIPLTCPIAWLVVQSRPLADTIYGQPTNP